MKKILLLLVLFPVLTFSQTKEEHREKIKALKTAYITEAMNLSPREAQKFWPVYNEYEKKKRSLYHRERAELPEMECITEAIAQAKLDEFVEIERQDYLLKKQYFADLKSIFDAGRIVQLIKVENEFNRKMWEEYRARRDTKKD